MNFLYNPAELFDDISWLIMIKLWLIMIPIHNLSWKIINRSTDYDQIMIEHDGEMATLGRSSFLMIHNHDFWWSDHGGLLDHDQILISIDYEKTSWSFSDHDHDFWSWKMNRSWSDHDKRWWNSYPIARKIIYWLLGLQSLVTNHSVCTLAKYIIMH